MLRKYVYTIEKFDDESKLFIIRQVKRMPDYYRFGVEIISFLFIQTFSKKFKIIR